MADFLLELLSEEIPARMQEKAAADLVRLFAAELARAGLAAATIEPFVTPRRLALIARGLPPATPPVSDERRGPRADAPAQAIAGFLGKTGLAREQLVERTDAKGNAVLFAVIERPGRATHEVLAEAVPAIVRGFPWPKAMRWGAASLSTESPRWVRPLQGVVALLDDAVVPIAIAGIASGRDTVGHRFLHAGPVRIANAGAYAGTLRAASVIVDADARRRIVRDGARAAAAAAGLVLVEDEGLVAENAGLTEWPVPLLGRFDPAFLGVPAEVIQLTARVNQKYFVCRGVAANSDVPGASHSGEAGSRSAPWEGALADAFVCTANIAAADGGLAIVEGNRKVLAARLADARFFYETDLKVPLAEQAKKLDRIVFHEKLGTVADKAARVAKLARWLVEEEIVGGGDSSFSIPFAPSEVEGSRASSEAGMRIADASASLRDPSTSLGTNGEGSTGRNGVDRTALADLAEQAALLCKADLVTGMVGEFPELQGVMGGYYARAEGLPDAVADAIRDHYKPVGQGDDVPTALVTVAVSLADKLDSLAQFFLVDEAPTGSKDPFALRRAALGVISIILQNRLGFHLERVLRKACEDDLGKFENLFYGRVEEKLADFFADRLKVQQREAGVRHDLIDAVFALGGEDDLVRLLARVKALQGFVETADGANLLAGYRRAANILRAEAKKDGASGADRHPELVSGSAEGQAQPPAPKWMPERVRHDGEEGGAFRFPYEPDAAEQALADALDAQLPLAEQAIAEERFEDAMTALAVIRPAIDRFFDDVTVNSPDGTQRATRLALLDKFRAAMHNIADFSKIEG